MKRHAVAVGVVLSVGFGGLSAGAAEDVPQRSFSASTAGAPVALAVGGWQDEPNGAGRLEVDFAAGPAPATTSFSATWVTAPEVLRQAEEAQTVARALVADHIGNNATDAAMRVRVEYRTRQVGRSWTSWVLVSDAEYIRPARKPEAHYFHVLANATSNCECEHQAEFRVSGTKTGVDISRLTVLAVNGAA